MYFCYPKTIRKSTKAFLRILSMRLGRKTKKTPPNTKHRIQVIFLSRETHALSAADTPKSPSDPVVLGENMVRPSVKQAKKEWFCNKPIGEL
jgi:hypothetical protein